MISYKHKCIFIHVPKTGGSTIEEMFRQNGMPNINSQQVHIGVVKARSLYRSEFNDYFKFSVVRNPWDRVYSVWWNFKQSGKTTQTLEDFCKHLNHRSLLIPQYTMLDIHRGVCFDYIGRFEELEKVFQFVIDKFELKIDKIPHRKKRVGKPRYTEFYTPNSIDRVANFYHADINEWGYNYGE